MNISPINAYGYQSYMPRTQGLVTRPQNLPQKKGNTEKVSQWSFLGIDPEVKKQLLKKDKNPPKPAEATEIPLKGQPPKVSKLSLKEIKRNFENSDETIIDAETGTMYGYDKYGYVTYVRDEINSNERLISRKHTDSSVVRYEDVVRDANGNVIRSIHRRADGSVVDYNDTVRDENGKRIREIYRKADGSVVKYNDFVRDENGDEISIIFRASDGSVLKYCKDICENGVIYCVWYDADGTAVLIA